MIDPEKAVRRIAIRRVMDALGLDFDGRVGVCPRCGRRTLRYIPNANRVRCRTCFRRPATNIDLVMRVRGVSRDEAMTWLKSLVDAELRSDAQPVAQGAQRMRMRAQATCADLRDIAQLLRNLDEGAAQLAQQYNHKNKMKDASPALVATCAMAILYAHASDNPDHIPAGTVERELVAFAMRNCGARVTSPKRLREAWKTVKRLIAANLLHQNPVCLRTGEPFCVNRQILLPLYNHDGVFVGMAATDYKLAHDALLLVSPAGRLRIAHAHCATVARSAVDAMRNAHEGREAWILHPAANHITISTSHKLIVPEWAIGTVEATQAVSHA